MNELEQAWSHVRGLEEFSLCDWPGHPGAVIFLGGCNLLCPTCHNFKMAWDHNSLPEFSRIKVLKFLESRKKWFDGLTITGGEPTCVPHVDYLLEDIADKEIPIKFDTNGMRPAVVEKLLQKGHVDTFAVDIKGPFELYPALTGNAVSANQAKKNISAILEMAKSYPESFYFRLTRVPMITDTDEAVVREVLPEGFSLTVQDYIAPRREDAKTDNEERRPARDLVHQ
ncbi:MAG: anaerobic ribonucleoside-triphosphate reductase activating protein [Desulfovibrio sp.]